MVTYSPKKLYLGKIQWLFYEKKLIWFKRELRQNLPSSNMYLSLNKFQYFPRFLTKLRDFGVIGCTNWKAAKTIRESAVEEQSKK
jgi:hypothetical protein